jgi:hypothetical protein
MNLMEEEDADNAMLFGMDFNALLLKHISDASLVEN